MTYYGVQSCWTRLCLAWHPTTQQVECALIVNGLDWNISCEKVCVLLSSQQFRPALGAKASKDCYIE